MCVVCRRRRWCCRVIAIHSIVARSYYIVCYGCMCTAWDFGSSNHLVGIVMGFKTFYYNTLKVLYICMNHPHVVPVPYLPCTHISRYSTSPSILFSTFISKICSRSLLPRCIPAHLSYLSHLHSNAYFPPSTLFSHYLITISDYFLAAF